MSENSQRGLGVTAARGVFWVGGGQVFRQLVGLTTAIILARLLAPEDFGLIAMAYVFIALAQLFADFGIGAAIIQSKDTDPRVISSAFWANIVVGIALAIMTAAAAPAIAGFYDDERLLYMTLALSLTLLLSGAVAVPRAVLYRDMRFNRAIQAQMVGSLAGGLVAVTLAWNGFSVWSLVWQPICGSGISFVLTFAFTGWRPIRTFSWRHIRHLTSFSFDVLGADLLDYARQNSDKLIIGKFLGSTALGYYNLAFQLMLYPLTYVAGVIAKVLFPTLSFLQKERARLQQACLKATAAVALITFPMMVGLFLVADDFVLVVFGEKWAPMRPVLQILCLIGMLQSVGTVAGTIYLSTGRTRTMFHLALVSAPVTVAALVVGLPWGIVGVAFAYAVATIVLLYVNLWFALRIIRLRLRDYHAALLRPLIASSAMAAVVWFVQSIAENAIGANRMARLMLCVAAGIVSYVLAILVFNRAQLAELRRLVTASLKHEREAEK
jgi:PST family polysaccharide transporter